MIALIAGEDTPQHTTDILTLYGITAIRNKPPHGQDQTAWQAAVAELPIVDSEPDIVLLFNDVPRGPSAILCKINKPIYRVGSTE